jgi:nicotinate-nucleotide adenylyltransferase
MNIAVYSGSFNPLHIGHLAIMKYLTGEGGFECVYLIVSPKNPLKDSISAESGLERYNAAIEAVRRHFPVGKVKVDDIELSMPAPHYTIRTLDALCEREPDNSFTMVMGADNLADIRRWRNYSRILKEYGTAVYPRKGYDLNEIISGLHKEDSDYRITIMKAEMVDISSTTIRNAISQGQDMSLWLM